MFFSLLNRFFPKTSSLPDSEQPCSDESQQKELFHSFAKEENGISYENFNLFFQEQRFTIDLLLFLPYRGLLFGEKLPWSAAALDGAKAERPTQKNKNKSTTHLETTQSAIQNKLEQILSFDSTLCERFIWLSCLSEDQFETLHPSFHELLPKDRLIFSDSSKESIFQKLTALAPRQSEPYSTLKVMGTLQSHKILLPTQNSPYGTFLSDEQNKFLETDCIDGVTTLFGEHNSGKSTLIIRKILLHLLLKPNEKILIVTPTLLGGEILRNELISLAEYGALTINHTSLIFCTPKNEPDITAGEIFHSASVVICDDAYAMDKTFIDTLIEQRKNRWLILSMHNDFLPVSDSTHFLHNNYQKNIPFSKVPSTEKKALLTLLLELRQRLQSVNSENILVILQNDKAINDFKDAIDEYFQLNARILTPEFSLQYQSLDDLTLTGIDNTYGLHLPHVYFIGDDVAENYSYALSRASESATIISFSNPKGADNGQNNEK